MSEEKYLVGIIDNEAAYLHDLQNNLEEHFETIPIDLIDDIDKFIDSIVSIIKNQNVSALIVDFTLSDNSKDRNYTGSDVIKKLHEKIFNFPAVIITSHSEIDAEDTSENPYLVFEREKDLYEASDEDRLEFIRKFKKFIERYNISLDEMEKEYRELKAKENNLTLAEEERLLKLEQELVNSPRDYDFSAILKSSQSFKILDNLEKTSRELLEKIKFEKK